MQAKKFRNSFLKSLDAQAVERLRLRSAAFDIGHEMEYPGRPLLYLYFIEEGMACMTITFSDGSQAEVGMFGSESILGVTALMGARSSLNRVSMQIEGHGYRCSVETARKEFRLADRFQALALRYVQAQWMQATQAAGCNAKHSLNQRLARWLLTCSDKVRDRSFKMSHEALADMLGVTRPTISLAARPLKEARVIEYRQGMITLLDIRKLEARACECYGEIRHQLGKYRESESSTCL